MRTFYVMMTLVFLAALHLPAQEPPPPPPGNEAPQKSALRLIAPEKGLPVACYLGTSDVTVQEYTDFLNALQGQRALTVRDGGVYPGEGVTLLCATHALSADSRIGWDGAAFSVLEGGAALPVVVSLPGAALYCNWLGTRQHKPLCYTPGTWVCSFVLNGYRLPTREEWTAAGGDDLPRLLAATGQPDATALARQAAFRVALPVSAEPSTATLKTFVLSSPAVKNGGQLPVEFTGDGDSASPPLAWSDAPAGTKCFALVMHHIAPDFVKWYWILYDIPAATQQLAKNTRGVGVPGSNSVNHRTEYAPPHSKGPGVKEYICTLYALSEMPKLSVPPAQVTRDLLLEAMRGHILASAELHFTYERTGAQPMPAKNE